METIGYFSAVLIGISLGLIGGGGSILTVPVLVYFFALDAVAATAYSLFIVGTTSLIGAIRYIQKKEIDLKTAFIFAIPSLVSVYSVRRYLMPVLPETIFTLGDIEVSKNAFIILFFSIIMLAAALKMIFPSSPKQNTTPSPNRFLLIGLEGIAVGAITGFVGAGGGFLIIPALVLLVGLPMKKAVATSLLIIAIKSIIGFIGDIQNMNIDWTLLLPVSAISLGGLFIGTYLNKILDGKHLKSIFGWFVLIMALFIILKETLLS